MEVVRETAVIMFIVAASSLYGFLLIRTQIPMALMNGMLSITQNPIIILLMLNAFLLIVGCFMESTAAIIILTPLIMPMTTSLGIDPVHMGLIMVLNLMIGLLTPPVGMCLYTVCRVAKLPFDKMVRAILPFYFPLLLVLFLITFVPAVVLWFPNLLLG